MGGNALGSAVSIESSSLYLGSEEFTSTVQLFFQSEVNQIAAQIPDAFVQLVYQPVKAANWFVVAQSGQVWLDSETNFWERLGLEESWLDTLPPSELSELPLQSEKWGYMYPLYCSDQVSCLLLGTSQPLSTMQRQVIDKSIQSLNEYLGLFQKYRHQKVLVQSLIQTFHHIEHQIRQPLALIEIYTEILSSQLQESEWRSQISSIQAAVKELSAHLKELTVCNQLQSTKPHSTKNPLHDLCMILAEALEGLQPWIAQKHLKIQHSLESAMLNVNAWQLKQVLAQKTARLAATCRYFTSRY
jgi:signal transduction histidine kinase